KELPGDVFVAIEKLEWSEFDRNGRAWSWQRAVVFAIRIQRLLKTLKRSLASCARGTHRPPARHLDDPRIRINDFAVDAGRLSGLPPIAEWIVFGGPFGLPK